MITRPRAILAVASLALGASLALSGCSLLPHLPSLGNHSSGNGSKGDDIKDNPFLGHDVPADFPSDVPLPNLEVAYSLSPTKNSWAITYKAKDLEGDFASAVSAFQSAGWDVQMNNSTPDGVLGVFMKDSYTVQVMGGADGGSDIDGPYLSFTVVQTN